MNAQEKIHIVSPTVSHTHTVIFLHGRDSVARDFADEFFESQATDGRLLTEIFPSIKWIFPNSGIRYSARFGVTMSQWFDIWSVEEPQQRKEVQVEELRESVSSIIEIVREEARVHTAGHIFLGGISQGCATAILALMMGSLKIAGFVGLCSWLPLEEEFKSIAIGSEEDKIASRLAVQELLGEDLASVELQKEAMKLALDVPVFLAHSMDDDVVPVVNGQRLADGLERLGFGVTRKIYTSGGHWVHEPEGIDDISSFIKRVF